MFLHLSKLLKAQIDVFNNIQQSNSLLDFTHEKEWKSIEMFVVNIFSGLIVSSTLVSMLSVLLVAVDRFLYILYGLQYQRYIYPNRARILIVTTWILGELLAISVPLCWNLVSKSIYMFWFESIKSETIQIEFRWLKLRRYSRAKSFPLKRFFS